MAEMVHAPTKCFLAAGAIGRFLRVKYDGSFNLVVAVATDFELGVTEYPALAAGDSIAVRLRSAEGTVKMVAAGAITRGAVVYAAAAGKIASTGSVPIGKALNAAGADGDYVEVIRAPDLSDVPNAVAGLSASQKVAGGEVTLDGGNPTPIVTGLATVTAFSIVRKGTGAPGVDLTNVSCDYGGGVTAGTVNVYAWKITASGDATEIASTNSSAVYSWVAIGT
jgi:hypothetical protein